MNRVPRVRPMPGAGERREGIEKEQKEYEGTPGNAMAGSDREKGHRPPRTAQLTPRHRRYRPGLLIPRT